MKISFLAPLKALNGEDIKDSKGEIFTLRDAAVVALDSSAPEDGKLEGKEKYRRGHLASKIYGAKEPIALDVDDVKLVKDLIGRSFGPRVVNEAWDLLDPPAQEEIIGYLYLNAFRWQEVYCLAFNG